MYVRRRLFQSESSLDSTYNDYPSQLPEWPLEYASNTSLPQLLLQYTRASAASATETSAARGMHLHYLRTPVWSILFSLLCHSDA